jgi:hypothetical protein
MAEKMKMLNVRIDAATDKKIEALVENSQMKKSAVVRKLLTESMQRVILKDGTKIALELEKIDTLLNSSDFNEEIKTKIMQVCDTLYDEIYKVFQEGEMEDGNLEDDKCEGSRQKKIQDDTGVHI